MTFKKNQFSHINLRKCDIIKRTAKKIKGVRNLNLKFTDIQNQKIVDAILIGLRRYVAERKQKENDLLVSDAYAYVRSNIVDDALGKSLKEINISYEKKKISGWGYLEYSIEDEKILFLVKSPSFIEKFQEKRQGKKEHYIREFSKNNDALVHSSKFQNKITQKQLQLDLGEVPELANGSFENIDRSYVIVYTVGEEGMVKTIESYLPNSQGELYLIQNLTPYIESSSEMFTEEEVTDAAHFFKDETVDDNNIFKFEVIGELGEQAQ